MAFQNVDNAPFIPVIQSKAIKKNCFSPQGGNGVKLEVDTEATSYHFSAIQQTSQHISVGSVANLDNSYQDLLLLLLHWLTQVPCIPGNITVF